MRRNEETPPETSQADCWLCWVTKTIAPNQKDRKWSVVLWQLNHQCFCLFGWLVYFCFYKKDSIDCWRLKPEPRDQEPKAYGEMKVKVWDHIFQTCGWDFKKTADSFEQVCGKSCSPLNGQSSLEWMGTKPREVSFIDNTVNQFRTARIIYNFVFSFWLLLL